MERIVYITVLLSVVAWAYGNAFRLESEYNLNNLLEIIYSVSIAIVLTGLVETNREEYLLKPLSLVIYAAAFLASSFLYPLIGLMIGDVYLQFHSISHFQAKAVEVSAVATAFVINFASNAIFQRHNGRGKKYLRVYGCFLCVFFGLCVTAILLYHGEKKVHLHHYAVAFAFALCSISNHPLSVFILGCSNGVMVEGLTMYGSSPTIYTNRRCGKMYGINHTLLLYKKFCCNLPEEGYMEICTVGKMSLDQVQCSAHSE